jgi:hypothetical protein
MGAVSKPSHPLFIFGSTGNGVKTILMFAIFEYSLRVVFRSKNKSLFPPYLNSKTTLVAKHGNTHPPTLFAYYSFVVLLMVC